MRRLRRWWRFRSLVDRDGICRHDPHGPRCHPYIIGSRHAVAGQRDSRCRHPTPALNPREAPEHPLQGRPRASVGSTAAISRRLARDDFGETEAGRGAGCAGLGRDCARKRRLKNRRLPIRRGGAKGLVSPRPKPDIEQLSVSAIRKQRNHRQTLLLLVWLRGKIRSLAIAAVALPVVLWPLLFFPDGTSQHEAPFLLGALHGMVASLFPITSIFLSVVVIIAALENDLPARIVAVVAFAVLGLSFAGTLYGYHWWTDFVNSHWIASGNKLPPMGSCRTAWQHCSSSPDRAAYHMGQLGQGILGFLALFVAGRAVLLANGDNKSRGRYLLAAGKRHQ